METCKAHQLLPFLLKLSEVTGIPGNTLEEDGIEEYYIPSDQQWVFDEEIIERVSVETDEEEPGKLFLCFYTITGHGFSFDFIDDNIELELLQRYTITPNPFIFIN